MTIYKDIPENDPLRDIKEAENRRHEENVAEVIRWKEENPDEWNAWLEGVRESNQQAVIDGAAQGWWDVDENGEMLAPPTVINSADLPDNATMAHVMAKAGIFPSISQARKNGWDKPLTTGVFTVTKKKFRIKVV